MDPFLVVLGLVIFFILLPDKWDPAIWLKEFNERWAKRIGERDNGPHG